MKERKEKLKKSKMEVWKDLRENWEKCGVLASSAHIFCESGPFNSYLFLLFSLCCQCGVPIPPNPANMCVNCLKNEVDITDGIPKQSTVHFCKFCERYLNPPAQWALCQPESAELMALCLKRLKGLSKVRLVDASFIWTEPHSKRIKVKLTIQKEVWIFVAIGILSLLLD